jgi:hypothetical protein
MADRNDSFFGPVLPQDPDAPEAFSFDEIQRIRAARMAADLLRTGPSAWPERPRHRMLLPQPRRDASDRPVERALPPHAARDRSSWTPTS